MTALAQNSPQYWHPGPRGTRRATKILRGIKIFSGAVCLFHNDRLMPVPPGGFGVAYSVAKTVAQGGPLLLNIESPNDVSGDLVGAFRRARELASQIRAVLESSQDPRAAEITTLIRTVSRGEVEVVD